MTAPERPRPPHDRRTAREIDEACAVTPPKAVARACSGREAPFSRPRPPTSTATSTATPTATATADPDRDLDPAPAGYAAPSSSASSRSIRLGSTRSRITFSCV